MISTKNLMIFVLFLKWENYCEVCMVNEIFLTAILQCLLFPSSQAIYHSFLSLVSRRSKKRAVAKIALKRRLFFVMIYISLSC